MHTSGNSAETFLACSIPDLQLNPFTIQLNGSYLEVNTVLTIKWAELISSHKLSHINYNFSTIEFYEFRLHTR
jgi:hypothetical protein